MEDQSPRLGYRGRSPIMSALSYRSSFSACVTVLAVCGQAIAGDPIAKPSGIARTVTTGLPEFDRVEFVAIAFEKGISDIVKEDGPDKFPIRPYQAFGKILSRQTLANDDCTELRTLWTNLTFDRFAGAMCHAPVYGLRFYSGDKLLFETTICWKCRNFYVPNEDGDDQSHGWFGFRSDKNSKRLLAFLRKHLKHPQLENG